MGEGLVLGDARSVVVDQAHPGDESGRCHSGPPGKCACPSEAAPLSFREPAPDPELLTVGERVLEALLAHDTPPAHLFCLARRGTTLGEEEIRIDTQAVGLVLPAPVLVFQEDAQAHSGGPPLSTGRWASAWHPCNYNGVIIAA